MVETMVLLSAAHWVDWMVERTAELKAGWMVVKWGVQSVGKLDIEKVEKLADRKVDLRADLLDNETAAWMAAQTVVLMVVCWVEMLADGSVET